MFIHGLLLSPIVLLIVFVSAGMPDHFLWQALGIPLIVAFVCLFAAFGFYAAHASVKSSIAKQNRSALSRCKLTPFGNTEAVGRKTDMTSFFA